MMPLRAFYSLLGKEKEHKGLQASHLSTAVFVYAPELLELEQPQLSDTFMVGKRVKWGFPGGSDGKKSACDAGDGFNPWIRKIPWKRAWQPTPVFLPRESHGYSPWDCK